MDIGPYDPDIRDPARVESSREIAPLRIGVEMMHLAPLLQEDSFVEIETWAILLLIAIWLGSIIAAGYIATESGRLTAKWVLWAMLIGPLAVVILLVSVRLEHMQRDDRSGQR